MACRASFFFCRFCPSVFLYLASVCPAIWLIELDKLDTRLEKKTMLTEAGGGGGGLGIATTTTTAASTTIAAAITGGGGGGANLTDSSKVDLSVLKNVGVSFFRLVCYPDCSWNTASI